MWYFFASILLAVCAVFDWRSRQIPRPIGFGLLGFALVFMLFQKAWQPAVFFALVIFGSRSKKSMLPSMLVWFYAYQIDKMDLAFGVGLYLVTLLFWLGWFQGGDAQVAYALMAFGRDWWMVGYLLGGTIVVGLVMILTKYGLSGFLRRSLEVARNLNKGLQDKNAIQLPWIVIASAFGMIHFWLAPGVGLSGR